MEGGVLVAAGVGNAGKEALAVRVYYGEKAVDVHLDDGAAVRLDDELGVQ